MKMKICNAIILCYFLSVAVNAQDSLKIDEAKIKAALINNQLQADLIIENSSQNDISANVKLEVLDAEDKVVALTETLQKIRRGQKTLQIPVSFTHKEDADELLWKRLRYTVSTESSSFTNIVSLSEIMPEIYELQISTPEKIFAGMNLRAHVLAVHPFTKKPVKNVEIAGEIQLDLDDANANEDAPDEIIIKAKGATNAEGFATLDFKVPAKSKIDDCCSYIKIRAAKNGILREAKDEVELSDEAFIYLNTDKPIYQPTQKLFVRGLYLDTLKRPLAAKELEFEIEDEAGETVHEGKFTTSRFGVVNIEWQIPEQFKLGKYKIQVEDDGDDIGATEFKVSRYDLPNFAVETRTDKPFYLPDQITASVTVSGKYLFGKPVAKGKVKIVREKERNWNYDEQKWETEEGAAIEAEANADGDFTAQIDLSAEQNELQKQNWKRFADLKFAAYYTDPTTNRTEQKRFDIRLSKEPIHIYFIRQAANANPKLPFLFYVSTFYADGTPAKCDLKIEGNYEDADIGANKLAAAPTNAYGAGKFEIRIPEKPFSEAKNEFNFRIYADDKKGSRGTFADNVYVNESEKQIRIVTDKAIYLPNEIVETKIYSTESDQTVFVDVLKSGSVIYSKRVKLGDGRTDFSIPFRPDFKGELTIAAYLPSERHRYDFVVNSKTIIFPVPNALNFNLKSLKTFYRPHEDAKISFTMQNGERKPLETALGVVILDKAIEERARTEQLPDNLGAIRKLLGTQDSFGNLTRRDLNNFDAAKPITADLQLAAEFLLVSKSYEPNFFASNSYQYDFREVYKNYFPKKLIQFEEILQTNYDKTGEYPKDENSLRRILAANGVNFDELRDAWNTPFRVEFMPDRAFITMLLKTAGADKKIGTEDDFIVKEMRFEWFKGTQNKLNLLLNNYLQTGKKLPRTSDELKNIWKQSGIEFDSLRDGWNHPLYLTAAPYNRTTQRVTPETIGNLDGERQQVYRTKTVSQETVLFKLRSAGANGIADEYDDDFDVATFFVVVSEKDLTPEKTVTTISKTKTTNASGAIGGVITDPQGAVVPGVEVKAVNQNSLEEFSVRSGDGGEFLLVNLPSGKYNLSAESPGFQRYVIENVVVGSMSLINLEIALDIGSVSSVVEVTADSLVTLESTSNAINSVTKSEQKSIAGFLGNSKNAESFTPRVREYFPETLLWSPELITDKNGKAELKFKLGDNLTTWKLYAVGSTATGEIGLVEKEFQTFQPFFAELDPPKILTEGDEILLPIQVRNYTDKRQKVAVSVAENGWSKLLNNALQNIEIARNSTENAIFSFRAVSPVVGGKLKVTAMAKTKGDAIEKSLTVKPDGREIIQTQSSLFANETAFEVKFPADAFPATRRTQVKIYPNMLAHVAESVEGLLERPHGCGEQTTSSTYPNLMILKIEKEFGEEIDTNLKKQAKNYLNEGYKRLLNYQTPSGGFSYWGKTDAPNTALTAYILRFLNDAKGYTKVEETVIENAERWLLSQQKTDGSWESSKGNTDISTAYIARSLSLTDKARTSKMKALQSAFEFLKKRLPETKNSFVLANLALIAEAFGESETSEKANEILQNLAQTNGEYLYWKTTDTPFYGWGTTAEIEATALVLQSLIKNENRNAKTENLISKGLAFLLKNKDRHGVWHSTQTTVNVLDALILLQKMQKMSSDGTSSKVEVLVNGVVVKEFSIAKDGLRIPFIFDVSEFVNGNDNRVEIKGAGGLTQIMAQMFSVYYVDWKTAQTTSEHFDLKVDFNKTVAKIGEEIICKVNIRQKNNRYGMALAEIGLPPGADVDRTGLDRAKTQGEFSNYDILPDKVLIYFWTAYNSREFSFKFKPRYGINAQNAPSTVYDYYNEEAKTTVAPEKFEVQ
jgi:A-macroglobulin TED domain/Alpha-2-macroglobulin family/MG2 domain/Carboxypeptidase regulatory-like domain/A-macroglobulin receptor binding domain/Macroglobulin domain MG3/Alpha-2-macroglobulin bait region domain